MFFRTMLYGKLREASSSEIQITDPQVTHSSFLAFLQFLYTGSIKINPHNLLYILYLSKYYNIEPLRQKCLEVSKRTVSESDVIILWEAAIHLGEDEIAKCCQEKVSANTKNILNSVDVSTLDVEILKKIVSYPYLSISEIELFLFVEKWTKAQENAPSQNDIKEIISHIRLPLISQKDLYFKVKPTKLVPPESYMEALEYHVCPEEFDKSSIQFQLRSPPSFEFTVSRSTARSNFQSWCYGGETDAIRVAVTKDVWLRAIGVYGGGSRYLASLDISDHDYNSIFSQKFEYISNDKSVVRLAFTRSVQFKQGATYNLGLCIFGGNSYSVVDGKREVEVNGCSFTFSKSSADKNGTDVGGGQIPELYFSFVE